MRPARAVLEEVFSELNDRISEINRERREDNLFPVKKSQVQLLGQISLLSNEEVSLILSLAQTGDMDAFLAMENVVKAELKKLLFKQGLVYDEDSYLIWVPPGARFEPLFDYENVEVKAIDPESALVSKAVKAPGKNKQLIREAIASDKFPALVDRILAGGGTLEDFA